MVKGYCLKDKKHIEIVSPVFELNKLGRPVVRGSCPQCGGKVYKILSTAEGEQHGLKAKKRGSAFRKSPARRRSSGKRRRSATRK